MVLLFLLGACGNNSNNNVTAKESCTQAVCPLGGHTYKFCTSGQAASCRYVGSDNSSFQCHSCSDCTTAANQIGNWCSTGVGNNGINGATTSGINGATTSGGNGATTSGGTTTSLPLNGCNGLLNCYVACNQSGGIQSCYDDCDAGATQNGLDLINTYGTCINDNCFMTNDVDSAAPFCTDPTIMSAECQSCYTRILMSGGVCFSAETACTNDKP